MPASSSTSSSDPVRRGVATFLAGVVLTLLPYELLVRRSEARWGKSVANTVMPRSATPKVDAFANSLAAGEQFETIVIGNSRAEYGLRPDLLEAAGYGRTYNLGMSGIPPTTGFELLEMTAVRPRRLIVTVSPIDFTALAHRRGAKVLAHAQEKFGARDATSSSPSERLTQATRDAFRALLHSSAPDRRRTPAQWLEFFRDGGDVLRFLNNSDAVGDPRLVWIRGYMGQQREGNPAVILGPALWNIPAEYRREAPPYLAALTRAVHELQQRGVEITLLRLPAPHPTLESENRETTFRDDMQAVARSLNVRYIDATTLMPPGFERDASQFFDTNHLRVHGSVIATQRIVAAMR